MKQVTPKFIYLDVGGVAIVDFSGNSKWDQMLDDLGILGANREQFKKLWKEGEAELCLGTKDTETLAMGIAEEIDVEFELGYKMLDDFVARFERNEGLCNILDKAKDKFRFGLLTNMYPGMLDQIVEAKLLPDMKWDVIVDSTSVKMQKPNKDIYEYAQQVTSVNPEEILFIDNTANNLVIPRDLGWQTFLYDSAQSEKSDRNLSNIFS